MSFSGTALSVARPDVRLTRDTLAVGARVIREDARVARCMIASLDVIDIAGRTEDGEEQEPNTPGWLALIACADVADPHDLGVSAWGLVATYLLNVDGGLIDATAMFYDLAEPEGDDE